MGRKQQTNEKIGVKQCFYYLCDGFNFRPLPILLCNYFDVFILSTGHWCKSKIDVDFGRSAQRSISDDVNVGHKNLVGSQRNLIQPGVAIFHWTRPKRTVGNFRVHIRFVIDCCVTSVRIINTDCYSEIIEAFMLLIKIKCKSEINMGVYPLSLA